MRRTRSTTRMLVVLATSLALGCTESDSSSPTSLSREGMSPTSSSQEDLALSSAAVHSFGYFGRLGPPFWGSLDPAWRACSNGDIQSPVDLGQNFVQSRRFHDLNIDYKRTTGDIFNNGHTIEVETHGNNVLMIGGIAYHLDQFHFHVPSENTIEGKGHDMELHLVHSNAAGANAVVAVFLDRGATSGALSPIFNQLPNDVDKHHDLAAPFNPANFLPRGRYNVRFVGSLTTPPCTEGVRWFVLVNPVKVSDEHLAQFHERVHFNARPVQRSVR